MDVFVARQPILDRKKNIYAYELLFRTGGANVFPDIDGERATTSLLSSSFFTVGIEKVTAGKLAFINFTEDLITKGTPQLFSSGKMMVEILEDVEPSSEIIEACKALKEAGYELALDDFVYSKKYEELLHLSDIIKIDFRLTPRETIQEMAQSLKKYNCKLLAEKVETYQEFEEALDLGFDYFQGYFFAKPEVLKNKDLSASQMTLMRLISQVNTSEFDVDVLGEIVRQDISISYKLLNYLNSAYFSRLQPISSLTQAISYLGENGFKLFTSLIATSRLAGNKPSALVRMAVIRARFLELLAVELKKDSNEMFLLGLFSLIDAMLDQKMTDLLEMLPLTDNITEALIQRQGELFVYLRLIETYEAGNWVALRFALKNMSVDEQRIFDFYLDALAWADMFE
jgi:EAL and modified HD-GYP domain-containing signal transduction protein